VKEIRTQVAIIGAGPAGLLLGQLLSREGIDNVVVEQRTREYVERRVRAGVIEFGIANLIEDAGAGDRMRREGLVHHGVEFRFDRQSHRIALSDLAEAPKKLICVWGVAVGVPDAGEMTTVAADACAPRPRVASRHSTARRLAWFIGPPECVGSRARADPSFRARQGP